MKNHNDNNSQLERISQMELRFSAASSAIRNLSAALDGFEAVQNDIALLDEYYGSEKWRQDFSTDEAGLLPAGLKRGVLSEDGLWNMLVECRELKSRIQELFTSAAHRGQQS